MLPRFPSAVDSYVEIFVAVSALDSFAVFLGVWCGMILFALCFMVGGPLGGGGACLFGGTLPPL